MQTPVASPKETLRSITIFFYTMIGGLLLFTLIIFAINFLQLPALTDKSLEMIFLVVVFVSTVLLTAIATRNYSKRVAEIRSLELTLMDKLTMYRNALIVYAALCEGPGIFAIIVYFLTGNKLLLIAIAFVLLAMMLKRPEKFKIFNELQLSSGEQSELN